VTRLDPLQILTESMKLYTIYVSTYNSVNLGKREKMRYNKLQTSNLQQNPTFSTPLPEIPITTGIQQSSGVNFEDFKSMTLLLLIFISPNFVLRLTRYEVLNKTTTNISTNLLPVSKKKSIILVPFYFKMQNTLHLIKENGNQWFTYYSPIQEVSRSVYKIIS
jgi:hypothetical protein